MAAYTGPATSNEAVVIEGMRGHVPPDRYATIAADSTSGENGCCDKLGHAHAKTIHNDIYERYATDTPESDPR